jgi:hypothetical protein
MADSVPTATRPAEKQGDTPSATAGSKPAYTVREGNVSGAVFVSGTSNPKRKLGTQYRVSLRRSYQHQGSGEWRHTHTLFPEDIPSAIAALEECRTFIEEADKALACGEQ